MNIRPGDAVFLRSGEPGIVKDRNEITGKLKVDSDLQRVKQDMRHGFINGLTPEQREVFNTILDEVKGSTEDPGERVTILNAKVKELEQDPKLFGLTRYVKAEMVHIMNSNNIKPREYSVQEAKLR
jgi:hypothetical protein